VKSRKQFEDELKTLTKEISNAKDSVSMWQRTLSNLEKRQAAVIQELAPKNDGSVGISDHALVRYMERGLGFNLDDIRSQILTSDRISAIRAGANSIKVGGIKFLVRDGTITTAVDLIP